MEPGSTRLERPPWAVVTAMQRKRYKSRQTITPATSRTPNWTRFSPQLYVQAPQILCKLKNFLATQYEAIPSSPAGLPSSVAVSGSRHSHNHEGLPSTRPLVSPCQVAQVPVHKSSPNLRLRDVHNVCLQSKINVACLRHLTFQQPSFRPSNLPVLLLVDH